MTKRKILGDHKRIKKRLVPPLLHAFGDRYAPYSWARQLAPQVVWIALLVNKYGLDRGARLATHVARTASEVCGSDPVPLFATITSFSQLDDNEKNRMLAKLMGTQKKLAAALAPLTAFVPENSLSFLCRGSFDSDKNEFSQLLRELYDWQSRLSVQCMAITTYIALDQGKLKMPKQLLEKTINDLRNIRDYPDTELSRDAGGSFRAGAPMLLLGPTFQEGEAEKAWLDIFWRETSGFGPCMLRTPIDATERIPKDPLGKLVFTYRQSAKTELVERLRLWGFELNDIEKYEVVGALLARQTTLAIEIATAPYDMDPSRRADSAQSHGGRAYCTCLDTN